MKNKRNIYSGHVNENQKYLLLRKYINEAIGSNETIKLDKEKEKEYLDTIRSRSGREQSHDYINNQVPREIISIQKRKKAEEEGNWNGAYDYGSAQEAEDLKDAAIKTFERLFSSKRAEQTIQGRFLSADYANFCFFHIPSNVNITRVISRISKLDKENYNNMSKEGLSHFEDGQMRIGQFDRLSFIDVKKLGGAPSMEKFIKSAKIYQIMYLESLKEKNDSHNSQSGNESIMNYDPTSITKHTSFSRKLKSFYTGSRLNLKRLYNDVAEKFKSLTGKEEKKSDLLLEIINLLEKVKEVFEKDQNAIVIVNYGMHNEMFLSSATTFSSRTPWMIAHRLFDNALPDMNKNAIEKRKGLDEILLNQKEKNSLSGFLIEKIKQDTVSFFEIVKKEYPDRNIQKIKYDEWKKIEKKYTELYPGHIAYPIVKKDPINGEYAIIVPRFTSSVNLINQLKQKGSSISSTIDSSIDIDRYSGRINGFNFSRTNPGQANIFKPQNFNTDKHIFNANPDFINEIMTYYLGRIVNIEGDKYIIKEKGQNKTVGILELSKEIFLPEVIQAYENDEDFINMLKSTFAPVIKKSVESMIETIEAYKGKLFFLKA